MSARTISENALVTASAATLNSKLFRLARGIPSSAIFIRVEIDGSVSGTNNLTIYLQGTPNPSDSDSEKVFINETDTAIWPSTVVTETEANATETLIYHVPGDYGVARIQAVRSGTGSNTFKVTAWISP